MILMIDNYDSFTYNLVQYLRSLDTEVEVFRNDNITIDEIKQRQPSGIVISPGPGRPESAGISIPVIQKLGRSVPILGVCLGHQSIGAAFGANIVHAKSLMHGKTSLIHSDQKGVFQSLERQIPVMRYHSLALEEKSIPDCFQITATAEDGEIMGIRHKKLLIEGIQFHPESIMTANGMKMLENFLDITKINGS